MRQHTAKSVLSLLGGVAVLGLLVLTLGGCEEGEEESGLAATATAAASPTAEATQVATPTPPPLTEVVSPTREAPPPTEEPPVTVVPLQPTPTGVPPQPTEEAPPPTPTLPPPTPTPPPPTPTEPPSVNCDPAYPDVCISPPPPDLDCGDIPFKRFKVLPPDPHQFDGDKDGIGCES